MALNEHMKIRFPVTSFSRRAADSSLASRKPPPPVRGVATKPFAATTSGESHTSNRHRCRAVRCHGFSILDRRAGAGACHRWRKNVVSYAATARKLKKRRPQTIEKSMEQRIIDKLVSHRPDDMITGVFSDDCDARALFRDSSQGLGQLRAVFPALRRHGRHASHLEKHGERHVLTLRTISRG